MAGMIELMSIDDCTLTMNKVVDGVPSDDIPIAVVRDVSIAKSRANKYVNTWGTKEDVFFVSGKEEIKGKFTFHTLTPEAWEMIKTPEGDGPRLEYQIIGQFTDGKWKDTKYTVSIEGIVLESDDFAFNLDTGPGEMTFNYRARHVTYESTGVAHGTHASGPPPL